MNLNPADIAAYLARMGPKEAQKFQELIAIAMAPIKSAPFIKPQPGPQTMFFNTEADIAIVGGANYGGKSFSLVVEPLKHIENSQFGAILFRRTFAQITNEGGIWDEAQKWYPRCGGKQNSSDLFYRFPSGCKVSFRHCQFDKDIEDYQSSQIALLLIDQLEQFTEKMFWGLLARNRSICGIKPYCRCACNPAPGSWLAELIEWWIDQETGFPILERSGRLRWFVRQHNILQWGNSKAELKAQFPNVRDEQIMSLTFIPSTYRDNQIGVMYDPSYVAKLMSLPRVERLQKMEGNWKVTVEDGMFETEKIEVVDFVPREGQRLRYWDKAGSVRKGSSWSVGVLYLRAKNRLFYVEDVIFGKWNSVYRNQVMDRTAAFDRDDYGYVPQWVEQEPGSGGMESAELTIAQMAQFDIRADKVTGDKIERAMPFAGQVCAGNVRLKRAPWNKAYLDALSAAPAGDMKDLWDCTAGAHNKMMLEGGGHQGSYVIYTGTEQQSILGQMPRDAFR